MLDVFEQVRRFAACDVPVLITGESGTGKELAARAIHERSSRSQWTLRGAQLRGGPGDVNRVRAVRLREGVVYRGHRAQAHGHIEHAHQGTLFLDEIGDMPIDLRGCCCAFCRRGRFCGKSADASQSSSMSALSRRPTCGCVRQSLRVSCARTFGYYRLNVLTLHLPALRERNGDVEVLAIPTFCARSRRSWGASFAVSLRRQWRQCWPILGPETSAS